MEVPSSIHGIWTCRRNSHLSGNASRCYSRSRYVKLKFSIYYITQFLYKLIGNVEGLKSSTIQVVNVDDANKTCHVTDEIGKKSDTLKDGMVIDGNILRINEILTNPMMINETFQFFIRAIGSQHVQQQRDNEFDGVAVFVLEQNQKTIGVFSANSPTSFWVKTYAPSNVLNSYINSYPKARLDSRVPPIKICTVKKLSDYLQI